jgi:hypothetical protein
MSHREQLIRARVGILTMAAELKNVAKACKLAGVSRSQFYAMRKAYQTYGREGLAPRPRRKPQMPNRTPAILESQILLNTQANPTFSYIRLAGAMTSKGFSVTPTMIRYVWQRHGLSTRVARQQWIRKQNGRLSGTRVRNTSLDNPSEMSQMARLSSAPPPSSVPVAGTVSADGTSPYNQPVQ